MIDVRGKEIKVGSTVAFPDRRGSRLWLNIAKVVDIATGRQLRWDFTAGMYTYPLVLKVVKHGEKRTSMVQRIDRVVVVK